MVMLKALEAAINQVETIHNHELTFTVDGQEITLRPLRSHEETEVQRYAQVAWEGTSEDGDAAAYQEFMDRVRLGTLGHCVMRIGGVDLHGVEWIDTGGVDEHGHPVSVPKWEAVRDLVREQWSKPLVLQVFAKFVELLDRVEVSVARLVKFDPSDLKEEIDRVERRLADLKQKLEDKDQDPVSGLEKTQKAVANIDQRNRRIRTGEQVATDRGVPYDGVPESPQAPPPQAPPPQAPPPQAPPPQAPVFQDAPSQRQSALPSQASPPERYELPDRFEETKPQRTEPVRDEQGFTLPHEGDSFFDPSDPEAALAAEAARQQQLHAANLHRQREQKMARQRAQEMGVPSREERAREQQQRQRDQGRPQATNLDRRTKGLREAANLTDHVFDAGGGRQRTGRPASGRPQASQSPGRPGQPQAPAKLHGKPVYKMPAQTLEKSSNPPAEQGEAPPNVALNPTVGGRQSKFRGPNE